MRRLAHFSVYAALALLPLAEFTQPPACAQQTLVREGDRWRRDFYGTVPVGPEARRLRVNAQGPVTVQAGLSNNVSRNLSFTVSVSVRARTEAEASRVFERYKVQLGPQGGWMVLTAPRGPVISTVTVRAPRLDAVAVSTSEGAVEVTGVDGPLDVDTAAGDLRVDRIRGNCKLATGGGDIRVGTVMGGL